MTVVCRVFDADVVGVGHGRRLCLTFWSRADPHVIKIGVGWKVCSRFFLRGVYVCVFSSVCGRCVVRGGVHGAWVSDNGVVCSALLWL